MSLENPETNPEKEIKQHRSPEDYSGYRDDLEMKLSDAHSKLINFVSKYQSDKSKADTLEKNKSAEDNFSTSLEVLKVSLKNFKKQLPSNTDIDILELAEDEKSGEKNKDNKKLTNKKTKLKSDYKSVSDSVDKFVKEKIDPYLDKMTNPDAIFKKIEENSPQKINEFLESQISKALDLKIEIENKKKESKTLSDSEKQRYKNSLINLEKGFNVSFLRLQNADTTLNKRFLELRTQIELELDKKPDDTVEKFQKVVEGLEKINSNLSKINADVTTVQKDGSIIKRGTEEFIEFSDRLESEAVKIDDINILIQKIEDTFTSPSRPSRDQVLKMDRIIILRDKASSFINRIQKKIDKEKNMSAKDQRDNAKAMSDRMVVTEKQISEAHDKLVIGEKFPAGEKEGFQVLLDVEDVNLKEVKSELEKLEAKNDDADNPTKILVRKIVDRIEKRLIVLHEKLDKERLPKEKDILEKLDAAEKEIEKTESKIRDISQKMAEEKNKIKQELASGDKNVSAIASIGKIVMGPTNPMTYHDQYDVSSEMGHALDDINTAKDWINMMPADDEKQRKLKNKLRSKSRRMYRRQNSVKWRHFMKLPAGQMGKYVGNKMIADPLVAGYDKVADRVFGGR